MSVLASDAKRRFFPLAAGAHERGTSLDIPRSCVRHTVLFVLLRENAWSNPLLLLFMWSWGLDTTEMNQIVLFGLNRGSASESEKRDTRTLQDLSMLVIASSEAS